MTYREIIDEIKKRLEKAGIGEAPFESRFIAEHVTGMSHMDIFMHMDDEIPDIHEKEIRHIVTLRETRKPLQYILGKTEFMGLTFEVTEDTLIPRQDTEILVEEAIKAADGKSILDVCTGTGCILISVAKYAKVTKAVGLDISKGAIALAKRNADKNGISAQFFVSDLFDEVRKQCGNDVRFDIITSNPPYIRTDEIAGLMPEVREHEPMTALDGKEDGLFFYKKIIREAGKYLVRHGKIMFEIGYDQADAVSELLRKEGYTDIAVVKDYAGLDRVVVATLD